MLKMHERTTACITNLPPHGPGKAGRLVIHADVSNNVCPEQSSFASGRFGAVNKMEGGPPLALYRQSQQTAPRCFPGNWEVLNGKGKKSRQRD
jgi:hypothetical protein